MRTGTGQEETIQGGVVKDQEREFDRYKEYTEALAATLMYERRYGPHIGAAGTGGIVSEGHEGPLRTVTYPHPK